MKVETDIIASITVSIAGGSVILVIMFVKTFKTDIIGFFWQRLNVFDVTLKVNFRYHHQSVDIENIARWDRRKNVWITNIAGCLITF